MGPVATSLTRSFGVSFTVVGLLSGTAYFAAAMVATPFVVPLAARVGVVRATAIAAAAMSAGHVLFAVSPAFGGLLAARIVVGAGSGFALVAGPVMARELGGVRLLGLFGGTITLGIAVALGLGSALEDAGITDPAYRLWEATAWLLQWPDNTTRRYPRLARPSSGIPGKVVSRAPVCGVGSFRHH